MLKKKILKNVLISKDQGSIRPLEIKIGDNKYYAIVWEINVEMLTKKEKKNKRYLGDLNINYRILGKYLD